MELTDYEKEMISVYRQGYFDDEEFVERMTSPECRGGAGRSIEYGTRMLSIAKN